MAKRYQRGNQKPNIEEEEEEEETTQWAKDTKEVNRSHTQKEKNRQQNDQKIPKR